MEEVAFRSIALGYDLGDAHGFAPEGVVAHIELGFPLEFELLYPEVVQDKVVLRLERVTDFLKLAVHLHQSRNGDGQVILVLRSLQNYDRAERQ